MRRSINRSGSLFFALLLVLSLPLMVPRSAEAATWRGQTLANVNLRTAPNLEGAVVTGVTKGRLVTVSGQQNGWFYVSFHEGTLEYHGWLYGRYVAAAKTTTPAAGSAFVGLLSDTSPPPKPAAPATTTPVPPKAVPLAQAKAEPVTRAAPSTPPPATTLPAVSVPAPAAKSIPSPAPAATATTTASVAKPIRSPKIVVTTPPPPVTGTDLLKMPVPSPGTVGTADLIHLALRLTMILISGMALFFAYRELKRLSERA